jgi:hypothetical protein
VGERSRPRGRARGGGAGAGTCPPRRRATQDPKTAPTRVGLLVHGVCIPVPRISTIYMLSSDLGADLSANCQVWPGMRIWDDNRHIVLVVDSAIVADMPYSRQGRIQIRT